MTLLVSQRIWGHRFRTSWQSRNRQPRNEQMLNPEPCTASLEEAGTGCGLTRDPSPWGEAASFRQRHRAEPHATLLLRCSLSLAGLRGLARANEIKGPQSEHRRRSPCRGPRGRVLRLSLSHTLLDLDPSCSHSHPHPHPSFPLPTTRQSSQPCSSARSPSPTGAGVRSLQCTGPEQRA